MLKKISKIGKSLNRNEQKNVSGGWHKPNPCDSYNGPVVVTCAQYDALPPQHRFCVLVSVECFPF